MDSLQEDAAGVEGLDVLSRFRLGFFGCLTARGDELFELADAVLCAGGPVRTLVGLSLASEHQRGHGALYDAVNQGRIDIGRLRRVVAGLPLPRSADGRLMLGVDVSNWLRPGAATRPARPWTAHPARAGVQACRGGELAGCGGDYQHRDHPLRHGRSSGLGPAAPPADPPGRQGRP